MILLVKVGRPAAGRLKFALVYGLTAVVVIGAALAVLVWGLATRDEDPRLPEPRSFVDSTTRVERGAYLARAGDCEGCHTPRGGPAMSGGVQVDTPFGSVSAPNLTPDDETGLGRWSEADFWRALHNGRSRDGRLLAPAFPYPQFTQIEREDAAALFAWLRSLPAVRRAPQANHLRWPYGTQPALAVWRALYFDPGVYVPDTARDATWNRGAYLVQGPGHCEACHSTHDALGGIEARGAFAGGLMPLKHWYAPSLASSQEAGVTQWDQAQVVALLKTGVSPRGAVMGPMADVVADGTRHLADDDLLAMAVYLRSLPAHDAPAPRFEPAPEAQMRAGGQVYTDHCARCHGDAGEGAPGAYPALAGNRSVTLSSPVNVVQAVLAGGYPPSTDGNPRPYGMPPFVATLDEAQVAAVATFVRQSWGNRASAVSALDVTKAR